MSSSSPNYRSSKRRQRSSSRKRSHSPRERNSRRRDDRRSGRKMHDRQTVSERDLARQHSKTKREGFGRITNINRNGFGFLKNEDGDDIFFHETVLDGDKLDDVEVGDKVEYVASPEAGKRTLRATFCKVISSSDRSDRGRDRWRRHEGDSNSRRRKRSDSRERDY